MTQITLYFRIYLPYFKRKGKQLIYFTKTLLQFIIYF